MQPFLKSCVYDIKQAERSVHNGQLKNEDAISEKDKYYLHNEVTGEEKSQYFFTDIYEICKF